MILDPFQTTLADDCGDREGGDDTANAFSCNEARALFDTDAYTEMPALVARATRSVRAEFFLFGGPVADAILAQLIDRMAHGVQVAVTLDRSRSLVPTIRRECMVMLRKLRDAGIDVQFGDNRSLPDYPGHPIIRHNKFLVIDEREALIGGMNVGTLFFRHHDVMIHLVGPAAADLARQFDHDRPGENSPAHSLSAPPLPPFAPQRHGRPLDTNQSLVRVLGTGRGRRTTRLATLQNLDATRERIWIAMSEIGRTDVLDAVIRAQGRGVDVRVLVDPQNMDTYLPPALGPVRRLCPYGALNAHALRVLLRAKVPVRLYNIGDNFALLHLKMAIFDGKSAIVGSTNWTRAGFEWVAETDVELHGGSVIRELEAQFELDWDAAAPANNPSPLARIVCSVYERLYQSG